MATFSGEQGWSQRLLALSTSFYPVFVDQFRPEPVLTADLLSNPAWLSEFDFVAGEKWTAYPIEDAWRFQSFLHYFSDKGFAAYLPIMLLGVFAGHGDTLVSHLAGHIRTYLSHSRHTLTTCQWMTVSWFLVECANICDEDGEWAWVMEEFKGLNGEILDALSTSLGQASQSS